MFAIPLDVVKINQCLNMKQENTSIMCKLIQEFKIVCFVNATYYLKLIRVVYLKFTKTIDITNKKKKIKWSKLKNFVKVLEIISKYNDHIQQLS